MMSDPLCKKTQNNSLVGCSENTKIFLIETPNAGVVEDDTVVIFENNFFLRSAADLTISDFGCFV